MKVRFEVNYRYEPYPSRPFQAKVTVYLPTEGGESQRLNKLLLSSQEGVWGEALHDRFGYYDEETHTRAKSHTVEGISWDDVKEKVAREIHEVIEALRSVKKRHEEALATLPASEAYEFEI